MSAPDYFLLTIMGMYNCDVYEIVFQELDIFDDPEGLNSRGKVCIEHEIF